MNVSLLPPANDKLILKLLTYIRHPTRTAFVSRLARAGSG